LITFLKSGIIVDFDERIKKKTIMPRKTHRLVIEKVNIVHFMLPLNTL